MENGDLHAKLLKTAWEMVCSGSGFAWDINREAISKLEEGIFMQQGQQETSNGAGTEDVYRMGGIHILKFLQDRDKVAISDRLHPRMR